MRFRDDIKVDLVDYMGSDLRVAQAARVSTGKDLMDSQKIEGLINYLVRENHSSPIEHCVVTFRVEAPIFVAREWMRHRTQSYNELSLRFSEAEPEFYMPAEDRPLVNEGSGAHPKLSASHNPKLYAVTKELHQVTYKETWGVYERMLNAGVASEVARNVLPVGVYTTFYATANLNNWLRFLTLRNGEEGAPQWEIVEGAKQVEEYLNELFPITMNAWRKHHQ